MYNGTFEDLFSKNESLALTIDQVFLKPINLTLVRPDSTFYYKYGSNKVQTCYTKGI